VNRSDATQPPEPPPGQESGGGGASLTRAFFDDFYGDAPDPWGFESRWYEERKRSLTMACLPTKRFSSAYEPGCSIGVLTAALAPRCDHLLATDISRTPLRTARKRLAGFPGVRFEQRRVPQEWPTGQFDLVMLSEIGYYCDAPDLDVLVQKATSCLTADGVLVACHWRHPVAEYPLRGDDVHDALRTRSGLAVLAEHREADFLLEVYVRPPAISVAGASGLLG
jgi:SAM-dependent methyltransferase